MHSQVSEISPTLVELTVEIPWKTVEKDLNDSFRKVGLQARVKGFRPGKVPRKVVRQIFGPQVRGEVTASLVEQGLIAAVSEHELQIVAQPEVEPSSLEDGKPFSFSAKVEVRPKIENVDTSNLEVVAANTEVADEEVNNEVQRLQHEHSELREPTPPRPAQAGDQLIIDYTVSVEGEDKPDMGATARPVELGDGNLLEAFEAALTGSEPGQDKTIEITFEDDHGREELRGKTAEFKVQVKELKERILPELDDEFAKDCGDYETLLELRLKLRAQLEEVAQRRADAELKDRIIEKLVETNDVPVPPSMVQQEEHRMMYEFATFMRMSGQEAGFSDDLQKTMKERAERKVKAAILLGALARQHDIGVEPSDVDDKLKQLSEESGKHIAKVRVEYQGERREALESELLEEKLMSYLKKQVKLVDAPIEETDPKPTAEPEARDDATDDGGAAESDD